METTGYSLLAPPSPSPELGFVELLGLQDFQSFSSPMMDGNNACSVGFLECSSEVVNQPPTTPNSYISSASNEEHDSLKEEDELEGQDQQDQSKTQKELKPRKPNQKKTKKKEPRVAFMTKSQVDHLEDGYRWRKYGQKAVKNSPFPRSYYRCTTASCNVKKRVERCFKDPSIVITTYEGQHIHPSPFNARGGGGGGGGGGGFVANNAHFATIPQTFNLPVQMGANYNVNAYLASLDVTQTIPTTYGDQGRRFCNPPSLLKDNGLLQDIVMMPLNMRLNDN